MDCSLLAYSNHGILQERILEWVAVSFSRGSSRLRSEPMSLVFAALTGEFFTPVPPRKPMYVYALVARSCPTLCDPLDCSLPSSSVHGIFQQEYWSGLPFLSPENFPDPGLNLGLLYYRQILNCLSHQGSPGSPYSL